jgi:hypothetical protein
MERNSDWWQAVVAHEDEALAWIDSVNLDAESPA